MKKTPIGTKASWPRWLAVLRRYFSFFALTAFIVSCCMILFLRELSSAADVELTEVVIRKASILTFLNVLLLSLLFTLLDAVRRKIMVDRPVRRIITAAEKIMEGDFSVRIQPIYSLGSMDGFNTIIDYFNRMAEELSGTETLRTDFISNVSHELKTPLAVIQNYGNMLAQPGLSEGQWREYAEAITDTSRRLANLITNILKLNKLENQQIFPTVRTYSLSEQLCECFLSFEGAWDAKNLEIETDLAENVMVDTDAELLSLVWNNLFSNAIKFTEPGGLVSLSLKTEGSLAIVTVSDTGCGISRETGAHIFEKFYQGDTSHAIQGNGLGLALVKRVIDIIGAEISVESEVGKGSTFIVKLKRSLHES